MEVDSTTALYFHSAVFQGNMALLALLAAFLVYRLALNLSIMEDAERAIVNYVQMSLNNSVPGLSVPFPYVAPDSVLPALMSFAKQCKIEQAAQHARELADDKNLIGMLVYRKRIESYRQIVKDKMKFCFVMTLITAILALLSLVFLPTLSSVDPKLVTASVLITAVSNIIALAFIAWFVWYSLALSRATQFDNDETYSPLHYYENYPREREEVCRCKTS